METETRFVRIKMNGEGGTSPRSLVVRNNFTNSGHFPVPILLHNGAYLRLLTRAIAANVFTFRISLTFFGISTFRFILFYFFFTITFRRINWNISACPCTLKILKHLMSRSRFVLLPIKEAYDGAKRRFFSHDKVSFLIKWTNVGKLAPENHYNENELYVHF